MNRNAESHFATLPHADVQRSRFDRSHSVKLTGNVGQIIPFLCDPVLPGDTWQISTSKILRLQTMVTPVMSNAFLDIYYFYVPMRLLWDHAKEFFGENTASAWYPTTTYSIPKIEIPTTGVTAGSLLDYLGLPPYSSVTGLSYTVKAKVNALRLRGYLKIVEEWFRDQNLENPINFYSGDSDVSFSSTRTDLGGPPFIAAKMHDYFTSCLPGPQKAANPVIVPSSGSIPVYPLSNTNEHPYHSSATSNSYSYNSVAAGYYPPGGQQTITVDRFTGTDVSATGTSQTINWQSVNLWAVPDSQFGLSFTVNDLRIAFQTQKFLEKQARGGSRYREILLSHFGVTSPDARQQVPEYLGGNRVNLNVSQVVNQAESQNQPLGNLGAFSQTNDYHDDCIKSFTEHGYIYGLMVVRYDHAYSQGAEYDWFVDSMYDFYWPVFASIGEQPVRTKEILFDVCADSTHKEDVFGYQEAWSSYRYKCDRCCAEMRPYVSNGLASWSFADVYTAEPTLSDTWIKEDKANVDRVLSVSSSVANQYWADFYVKATVTRPMPLYSIPGLIDHF